MMPHKMYVAPSGNLSIAWSQAFCRSMETGVKELCPLIVSVSEFTDGRPVEHPAIRKRLDQELSRHDLNCGTVASTIFPQSLWNQESPDGADLLFERYERLWPKIKKCRANSHGVYFRRLTAFQPKGSRRKVNQLKHVISTYRGGNHRRSALMASVFDPTLDHSDSRRLGFPCLHQVTFTPVGKSGLCVTGYYATQYLFERAYGNYLGLCNLGRFMAHSMGLTLEKMTCIASVASPGGAKKAEMQKLARDIQQLTPASVESESK